MEVFMDEQKLVLHFRSCHVWGKWGRARGMVLNIRRGGDGVVVGGVVCRRAVG